MRFSRLTLCFLLILSATILNAGQQPATSTSSKEDATESAVDAATVKGSTFVSEYFHFTYELPKDWKALDDKVRTAANRESAQEDKRDAETTAQQTKKASAKSSPGGSSRNLPAAPERYSLMAATPVGLESLADPVLPRINIWAHRRVPPLDKAMDQAQLLLAGRRSTSLVRPHEVFVDGHAFAVVEIITPAGGYQARYITELGDYLVGFDFLTQTEKELAEFSNTVKTVNFK